MLFLESWIKTGAMSRFNFSFAKDVAKFGKWKLSSVHSKVTIYTLKCLLKFKYRTHTKIENRTPYSDIIQERKRKLKSRCVPEVKIHFCLEVTLTFVLAINSTLYFSLHPSPPSPPPPHRMSTAPTNPTNWPSRHGLGHYMTSCMRYMLLKFAFTIVMTN